MGFLSLVLANIFGRLTRSALTVSGIAVAVCAVVALVGIARGFQRSLLEIYEKRGIDLLVLQANKVQQTSSVLPEELVGRIAALPGVQQASPTLSDVVALDNNDLVGVPVQGWPDDSFLLNDMDIVEGRIFTAADAQPDANGVPGGLLIGNGLAEATGAKVGGTIEVVSGAPYRVVGVFESFNVFESGSIIMPLAALQSLMLREGEVTAVMVIGRQRDEASIEKLRRQIEALDPKIIAKPTREFAENTPEMKMTQSVAWLTSSIALIVGSIGMLNTMLMAVFERTREIAMLRAIGWRKSRIVAMILWEAVLLALAGAVVGAVLALVLTKWLSQLPAGRMVSGDISPLVVAQGFFLAVLVGLLGGLYPAYRAAQLLPVEGLRHD